MVKTQLDNTDRQILYELDLNGRLSAAELGRTLSIPKETVSNRISRLEERGIVSHYSAIVNIAKLGYTPYGVFTQLQNVSEQKRTEIIQALKRENAVYSVALFGGNYDLLFAIQAKDIVE